jgi:hypothetical protein
MASSDSQALPDGRMIARRPDSAAAGSRRLEANDKVIRTGSSGYTEHALTSKVPDRYLVEIKQFSFIPGPEASPHFAQVHGFERVPEQDALCGSLVRLITNQGNFSLDDTHLYHPTFGEVYATGHFDAERRLAAHHGRRMSTAALVGFFNFVEESEFECYTEWKGQKEEIMPDPPAVPYSYTAHIQRKCQLEDGTQQCSPQMKLEYPQLPGSSEDHDTMATVTRVLITEDAQFEVTFLPNHPLQREVTIRQRNPSGVGNGTMSHYQLFGSDPSVLFCSQEPVDEGDFAMNMSDSFLSYIGKQNHSFMGRDTEIRKWRMSLAFDGKKMTAQEQNGFLGPIEFWDTAAKNHTPYRLFSPSSQRVHDSVFQSFTGNMDASDVQQWPKTCLTRRRS